MKAIAHSHWFVVTTLIGSAFLPLQATAEAVDPVAKVDVGASSMFGTVAVDAQDLAFSRGGAEVTLNDLKSNGAVIGNQANNLTTGSNWVGEGSFAGASGFSTVLQNSGNNVLIQNATIINLQVK